MFTQRADGFCDLGYLERDFSGVKEIVKEGVVCNSFAENDAKVEEVFEETVQLIEEKEENASKVSFLNGFFGNEAKI